MSIYFGYYLGEQSREKKDKKEAIQMLNILQDEINNNLNNNLQNKFSSEYLSTLGGEVLRVKMGILAAHQKEHLSYLIKIYGQFNNINKDLSDHAKLEKITTSRTMMDFLPQKERYEKIVQLRSSCKKDIEKYLNIMEII